MSTLNTTIQSAIRQYRERGAAFWQARSEQERQFLSVGGAVLALALGYALLIAPALEGRARLRVELPQLRQQAAELQALALQAAAISGQPVAAPAPMTRDALVASLTARGLSAQSVALTGEYAKLQLNGVAFAGLLDWLEATRNEGRIAVQDAAITAQSTPGMVDATLTLHQNAPGSTR